MKIKIRNQFSAVKCRRLADIDPGDLLWCSALTYCKYIGDLDAISLLERDTLKLRPIHKIAVQTYYLDQKHCNTVRSLH